MDFSASDIERLEELARIDLEPAERSRLTLQLARIVAFVRALQDASPGEQGLAGPEAFCASPAEDLPHECLERREVLAAAPAHEDGLFRVPPVIEAE